MRILIADDHAIVRQGLRSLLEKGGDMEVIGEAEDGAAAVRRAQELCPDVIIMDITMPGLNGVEATRQILQQNPAVKVIVLSMHPDKHIVREALKAGALGYVLKSYLFDELLRALEVAAANGHYLSPRITEVVVEDYVRGCPTHHSSETQELTSVERRILQLLAEGRTIKQIAKQLHMSPKTVDAKRRAIMQKLGVSSVADLVKCAIRQGLTSLDF
jgi:DNA-binding NarL/FixJ family response regulator